MTQTLSVDFPGVHGNETLYMPANHSGWCAPVLNLYFHWSLITCTSIVFIVRAIVYVRYLWFHQPITALVANGADRPNHRMPKNY